MLTTTGRSRKPLESSQRATCCRRDYIVHDVGDVFEEVIVRRFFFALFRFSGRSPLLIFFVFK